MLRAALQDGSLSTSAFFDQLIHLIHRLVFLHAAEERGLLHPPGPSGQSLRWLIASPEVLDPWASLQGTFRGLAHGDPSLGLPALRGLFGPGVCPALDASKLGNRPLLDALAALPDAGPVELGSIYEHLLELKPTVDLPARTFTFAADSKDRGRHASGSYYTPEALVQALLDTALEPTIQDAISAHPDDPVTALLRLAIVDPACGSGHFLIAAARRLAGHVARLDPEHSAASALRQVVGRCIFGVDLNPMALSFCRVALWMAVAEPGLPLDFVDAHVQRGDALLGSPQGLAAPGDLFARVVADAWCASHVRSTEAQEFFHWHLAFPAVFGRGGFDVVLGNPPYLNQLETSTAVGLGVRRLLHARFGEVMQTYTDLATLFLVLGQGILRPGGRAALVHPLSFFAAQDAAPARKALALGSTVTAVWVTTEHIFPSAAVFVGAVTLQRAGPRTTSASRRRGNDFVEAEALLLDMDALACEPTWGSLIVDLLGIPRVQFSNPRQVRDLAGTTADFRDQFYGLAPFIVEEEAGMGDAEFPPLIITGLIDPAVCLWGVRTCKFAKRTYRRPRVDLAKLVAGGLLGPWARGRLTPKLIVATQTRVIEAFADPTGRLINTVPTITVTPRRAEDLWRLLAVLLSPPVSAWALGRYAGTALSVDAIKMSAAQVGQIPLPTVATPWERAARSVQAASGATEAVRQALLIESAGWMCDAYEAPREPVLSWWRGRLPATRVQAG